MGEGGEEVMSCMALVATMMKLNDLVNYCCEEMGVSLTCSLERRTAFICLSGISVVCCLGVPRVDIKHQDGKGGEKK